MSGSPGCPSSHSPSSSILCNCSPISKRGTGFGEFINGISFFTSFPPFFLIHLCIWLRRDLARHTAPLLFLAARGALSCGTGALGCGVGSSSLTWATREGPACTLLFVCVPVYSPQGYHPRQMMGLPWWISWRRERLPTLVFLPEEFHRQRSLGGYSPWGHKRVRHD